MQSLARIGSVCVRLIQPAAVLCLGSLLCGILLSGWLRQLTGLLGSSVTVRIALAVVLGIAGLLGVTLANRTRWLSWISVGLCSLLAVWSFATEWLLSLAWGVTESIVAVESWPSSTRQFCAVLLAATFFLLLPVSALVSAISGTTRRQAAWGWLAVGMLINAIALAPRWGLVTSEAFAGAGLLCVAALIAWQRRRELKTPSQVQPESDPLTVGAWRDLLNGAVMSAAIGMAFVAGGRLLDQLAISAWWYDVAKWSALMLGIAVGRCLGSVIGRAIAQWSATLMCVLFLAAFPLWVALSLDLNTYVSSPLWHAFGKLGIASCLCVPLGLCLGSALRATSLATPALGLMVGYSIATSLALPALGVASLLGLSMTCWLLAGLFSENWLSLLRAESPVGGGRIAPRHRQWAWVSVAATFLIMALTPWAGRNYDPALAAKLLFDSQVCATHRLETRDALLPHFDEGRCLAVRETDSGTLTLWRYRGVQTVLRSSGMPIAVQSQDAAVCPDASAEAMQIILPLVLHERPAHVLIFGAKSTVAAETSLLFPIQSVTCIEPDQQLLDVVRCDVWGQSAQNPIQDERLQCVVAEPVLALAGQRQSFDIIMSNPDPGVLSHAATQQTTEFYRLSSRALAVDGLFCQRLCVSDCGPRVVKLMLQACRAAYQNVATVEAGPGEWLLLATNSDSNVFRRNFVKRLQRSHVRAVLARLGWDWATPLELLTIDSEQLDGWFEQSPRVLNTVANGRLTAWLPWEVQRWGNKYAELTDGFGKWATPLKTRLGAEAETTEVTRRLTELNLQRDLVNDHPDEFWAYRKRVKLRLMEQPQSEIVQVKGQLPVQQLHANEQRRLQYFEALGTAAKQKTPGTESVAAVAEFIAPTDPLISFFARQEVAELASRNPEENAALELQERLHVAYFTLPGDRSVRNVISAIHLLCERPDLMPDNAQRGDHLDGLIQVLHLRWYNRGDASPKSSKVTLNDIEKSLTAIDAANTTLDELRAVRGLTESQRSARKAAVEKSLVKPLRNYRTTLLPHRIREELSQAPIE